ncbi:MAG: alkyl sulfatase dimerization domain-containing protein [archaeon]|nr:alkyl sulfatase dimerization domain-containing protein [archaeon]
MASPGEGTMVVWDPESKREIRTSGSPEEVFRSGDGRVRVLMHPLFVNSYVVFVAPRSLLVVDPGLSGTGERVVETAREWLGEELFERAVLEAVVYTHGHADHAFGTHAWVAAGKMPLSVVAHENCRARFERYRRTRAWNGKINKVQFSLGSSHWGEGEDGHDDERKGKGKGNDGERDGERDGTEQEQLESYFAIDGLVEPTVEYRDSMRLVVGGALEVQLRHHKGETDDATVVLLPQHGVLFTGDLVIWQACNCGNPQKVQRYCLLWARALQWMASLGCSLLLPGHGYAVAGEGAIARMLQNTSRYLLHLEHETVRLMNLGMTPEDIVERVRPIPELAALPYLTAGYDHPSFIVRNILRLYGGWWNGDPASLLPAPSRLLARELASAAGGIDALIAHGEKLLASGDPRLAAHFASFATKADPNSPRALALQAAVYERLLTVETALMAQGIYRYAANQARQRLHLSRL